MNNSVERLNIWLSREAYLFIAGDNDKHKRWKVVETLKATKQKAYRLISTAGGGMASLIYQNNNQTVLVIDNVDVPIRLTPDQIVWMAGE